MTPPRQLDLSFAVAGGRTVLARRHVGYPFNVTAPLRIAGPEARVIVQSVSGGNYGGEVLGQRITAAAGTGVRISMPSATVVHATRTGAAARQTITIDVGDDATLCYLPRPLILFPGSVIEQDLCLSVAASGRALLREGVLLHNPSSMLPAPRSALNRLTIRDAGGRRIAMDVSRIDGVLIDDACPGVTGGFRAFGTVWLVQPLDAARFQAIKAAIAARSADEPDCYVATTALRGHRGAVVRIAAGDGGALEMALDAATAVFEESLTPTRAPVAVP